VKVDVDRDVLVACVERAGPMKGARLAMFVSEWAIAETELGHEIGPEEFSDWWQARSRRTVYRRLSEYRTAFDGSDKPSEMFRARRTVTRPRGAPREALAR